MKWLILGLIAWLIDCLVSWLKERMVIQRFVGWLVACLIDCLGGIRTIDEENEDGTKVGRMEGGTKGRRQRAV